MQQVPLMLLSDAPDTSSGLGRITRDLASLMCSQPEWRVATLGLLGTGSVCFPWQQYHLGRYPSGDYEYGELSLVACWRDFAGETPGIVLTIFDLTRMLWLARPEHVADERQRADLMWLRHHIGLWGYFPQDHEGPGGALTAVSREVLLGYDRILVTSPWAVEVVRATIGHVEAAKRDLTWMPHGMQLHVFKPLAEGKEVPLATTVTPVVDTVPVGAVPGTLADTAHVPLAKGAHDDRRGARVGGGDGTGDPPDRADRDPLALDAGLEAPVVSRVAPADPPCEAESPARDPLEVAVALMSHKESTAAAVADVERMRREGALPVGAGVAVPDCTCGVDPKHDCFAPPWAHHKDCPYRTYRMPRKAEVARHVRIGVVGTNQARKDWGLAAAVCAKLRDILATEGTTFSAWWHVDVLIRAWSIPALLADYHLEDVVEVTLPPAGDKQMAACYRDCDLTLAIGLGEGFGYATFESLACGVPVLHGNYASGASLMSTCGLGALLIQPKAWRLEGPHNALRPVYNVDDWVLRAAVMLEEKEDWRAHVVHLDWQALGPRFRKWFRDGLAQEASV